MPLKYQIDKLEDVDEAVRPHYVEKDGKWFLDTDAGERVQEFRTKNIDLIKETNDLREKLQQFDGVDVEVYKTLQAERDALETQELLKKGDVDALLTREREKNQAEWNKRFEAVEGENKDLKTTLVKLKVTDELKSAAAAARVRPEALDDVVELASREWMLDNGAAVRKRGEEVVLSSANPGQNQSMGEYFEELARSKPFFFAASGGSGGQETRPGGAKILRNPTPLQMGQLAEEIAPGEVEVVYDA